MKRNLAKPGPKQTDTDGIWPFADSQRIQDKAKGSLLFFYTSLLYFLFSGKSR